ncbi:MAG: hypothetical protein CL679_11820 [Bermanella sp.]|nr:hypothetical protein [Bermanella sp.]|tara:strand:- start:6844 stop:7932 length:1089 start_codon:yes stop_codon:yes gene_type:complete
MQNQGVIMKTKLLFTFLLLGLPFFGAADEKPVPCEYSNLVLARPVDALSDFHEEAKNAGEKVCKNFFGITPDERSNIVKSVSDYTTAASTVLFQLYDNELFTGLHERVEVWSDLVNSNYMNPVYLPFLQTAEFDRNNDYIWQVFIKASENNFPALEYNLSKDDRYETACKSLLDGVSGCNNVFEQVSIAANPFSALVKEKLLEDNGEKLALLQADWQEFIDDARYQTPLDVWATTLAYSERYSGKGLSGPPPIQYFLFRPTAVYERIDSLPDGDQDKASLAVEWVGFNHWKRGVGVSIISTYRDSAFTSDIGTGLMVYVDNTYSFGFTHRGKNDNSFFVNIDVLEWLGDKLEVYEQYKDKMF